MGKPVETKRKKKRKGRPSLLDLQRRSLRLQKQQQQQEEEEEQEQQQADRKAPSKPKSPNPYLRFPDSSSGRHSSRPNPNPNPEDDGEDDEEDGKRREKKLKLVLRLHQDGGGDGDGGGSDKSESNGGSLKKRKIDAVGGDESSRVEKTERQNHASKATDTRQGGPSDSGPTTPLPDEKLLLFVLDRLQKKDTYGVFSEPVDPKELPDYHEIVEHPMDFSTVRKRLTSGYYANLEMFEKDVFLICSNAMQYNAPDTIYFRQARSIQELAKKNFENLREESSDDDEPEPKVVRRGRPPSKNMTKKVVGRPPIECASSDLLSGASLANAGDSTLWSNSSHDLMRKGFSFDKPGSGDASARTNLGLRNSEGCHWTAEKLDRSEESGSVKGIPMKSVKKVSVLDENRRNTYKQSPSSTCLYESPVLTVFDGEKRQLLPIGIHIKHAYTRSLARFAANLGPIGWDMAAKQIEKVLPPGIKFGRGWVGEVHVTKQRQLPLPSGSPPRPSSQPLTVLTKADLITEKPESLSTGRAVEGGCLSQTPAFVSSSTSGVSSNPIEGVESARLLNSETGFDTPSGSSNAGIVGTRLKAPFQVHQKMTVQPGMNGLSNTAFGFDLTQVGKMGGQAGSTVNLVSDVPVPHSRVLDMVSRGDNSFINPASMVRVAAGRPKPGNLGTASISPSPLPSQDLHSSGRGFPRRPKPPDSAPPPDLNVRFQSAGSPPPGMMADSRQQPDLALQL